MEKEKDLSRFKDFDIIITPSGRQYRSFKEIWRYRTLAYQLVRRDFVANYKQTILGPLWSVVQPIMSTLITAFVFGGLAGLSPDGIPVFLFYMSGQVAWNYFSTCLQGVSGTFLQNMNMMGKVYFPRIIVPIATVLSNSVRMLIQVALMFAFHIGYVISGAPISCNSSILLFPVYLIHIAILGGSAGAILSAQTTKYRDTGFLIGFGLSMWMYLTPVVYDVNIVPDKLRWLYMLNPMTPIINQMRYALFNQEQPYWNYYLISIITTAIIAVIAYKVFSRVERNFIDTI